MSKQNRILHVIPSLGKGGAERQVLDICKYQNKMHDTRSIVVNLTDINYYSDEEAEYIMYAKVNTPFSLRHHWQFSKEFDAIVDEYKPHIIHSHIYFADLVSRNRLNTQIKYFSHIHGRTSQYEAPLFPLSLKELKIKLEKWWICKQYRHCDNTFITVSNFYKKYLETHLPQFSDRIFLLPNAIDPERFSPSDDIKLNAPLRLINVGRLEPVKGLDLLLQVAKELDRQNVDFVLNIFGEGSQENHLLDLIHLYGLEKKVILNGNSDKIEEEYRHSDIYIHTALEESFGLTILEAMSTGLPVVCTDGGGNRDIVQDGVNGFILPRREAEDLVDIIQNISSDKKLYQSLSDNAIQFARKYNIADYVVRLNKIYGIG